MLDETDENEEPEADEKEADVSTDSHFEAAESDIGLEAMDLDTKMGMKISLFLTSHALLRSHSPI